MSLSNQGCPMEPTFSGFLFCNIYFSFHFEFLKLLLLS